MEGDGQPAWHCWAELALALPDFFLGNFLGAVFETGVVGVHDPAEDLSETFVSPAARRRGEVVYFLEHHAELLANS